MSDETPDRPRPSEYFVYLLWARGNVERSLTRSEIDLLRHQFVPATVKMEVDRE